MSEPSIEELQARVAILESQVAQLLAKTKEPAVKDWRRTLGMFTGDEVMRRVNEEARKYREQDRLATKNESDEGSET